MTLLLILVIVFLGLRLMKDCYCIKPYFGVVYIPPDNSIYSNIDMFNDIENTLLDNDLQVQFLIGLMIKN
jgi:hypothetical protein